MALDRQLRVLRTHALAVILDNNLTDPTAGDTDADGPGASVDRVLHQFFDHRGRPLDHLAGTDLLDSLEVKEMNAAHS